MEQNFDADGVAVVGGGDAGQSFAGTIKESIVIKRV